MTTIDGPRSQPKWRGYMMRLAGFMTLLAGLCTVFALVVTAALAWQEHAQARWPQTTARVQRCGVDVYPNQPEFYWIDCSLSFTVRGEDIVSHVHSLTIPAPQRLIWQYPPRQFEQMQEWVDEHPEGTPISIHYDPANHKKPVLVTTDMPRGQPQTPGNLKLLGFCAVSFAVLLTITRIVRPRTDEFAAAVRGDG